MERFESLARSLQKISPHAARLTRELGQELFIGDEGFITNQEQMDRLQMFNNANQEYKRFKIESAGLNVDEITEENWLQALLAEVSFFMAETLLQFHAAQNG